MDSPRTDRISACPVCKYPTEGNPLFASADRQHGTPGRFRYCLCPKCASVFQNPQVVPDDRHATYPNSYYTHSRPRDASHRGRMAGMRDQVRNWILRYHYGTGPLAARMAGRVLFRAGFLRRKAFFGLLDELIPPRAGAVALDIGCGSGKLLRALRLAGWAAEGVEWDQHAADVAAAYSECTVHTGDFSKLPLQDGKYGLVLLNHVFEHLDDPTQVLRRVGELLAPDGTAVLIYPNPAALGAKRFKEHWFSWEVPRHLVFVHPREASALAHGVGLEIVSLKTLHRSATVVSMLSRAYQRGRVLSTAEVVPGLEDHLYKWWGRLRMLIEPMTGEEVLLVLRRAKSRDR